MTRTDHYIKWRLKEYKYDGGRDNKPLSSFPLTFGIVVVRESIRNMAVIDTMSKKKDEYLLSLPANYRCPIN